MPNLNPEQSKLLQRAMEDGAVLTPQLVSYLLNADLKDVPPKKEEPTKGVAALKKVSLSPIRGSLCI